MNQEKNKLSLETLARLLIIPLMAYNFAVAKDGVLWRTYAFFDIACFLILLRGPKIHSLSFLFLFVADTIYGLGTEQIKIPDFFSNLSEGFFTVWSALLSSHIIYNFQRVIRSKDWSRTLFIFLIFFLFLNFYFVLVPFYHRNEPPPTLFNLINSTIYGGLAAANTSLVILITLTSKSFKSLTIYSGYLLLFFSDFATRYHTAFFPQNGAPWSDYGWMIGMGMIAFGLTLKNDTRDENYADLFSTRVLLSLTVVLISLSSIIIAIYFELFKINDAFGISLVLFLFYYSWLTANYIAFVVSNHFLMIIGLLRSTSVNHRSTLFKFFSKIDEVDTIIKEYLKIREKNDLLAQNNQQQEQFVALAQLSAQVSHDIRSPLAALEMISSSLNELPEEKRLITRNSINRIRDIANSLLDKNRASLSNGEQMIYSKSEFMESGNFSTMLLNPLIDLMVTEKRQQCRNQVGVMIDFSQNAETYGAFVRVKPLEFQRVLSNLINNSIDSFQDKGGLVEVVLSATSDGRVEIKIKDNGCGIPSHVLSQIGKRGITFGKKNGNGLGIHHALSTIENFGGEFKIESNLNQGTIVSITLNKEESAPWFVPVIKFQKKQTVVIFDDDQSIHQIWSERLDELKNSAQLRIHHFSSAEDFRHFYRHNYAELDTALFLMDYEIIGSSESGLDLIEMLNIQNQSILVTSRYEEKSIRDRCELNGVKLIPKLMSAFVPFKVIDY